MRSGTQKISSGWLIGLSSLLCLAVSVPAWADLNDGLVAHWSFDDCTAKDITERGNNGGISGTPKCVTTDNGKALDFNGTTDYVSGRIDPSVFSGNWTITGVFNHSGYGSPWEAIFSNSVGTPNTPIMTFSGGDGSSGSWVNTNLLGINMVGSAPTGVFVDLGNHFDTWIVAAITQANGMLTVYAWKDGKLITNRQPLSWRLNVDSGFYIARHYDGDTQLFKGIIDDVRVYNRALSPEEIQDLSKSINNTNAATSNTVSGSISGLEKTSVTCKNLVTGDKISISKAQTAWDCEAAGLTVAPGEKIQITIKGSSDH